MNVFFLRITGNEGRKGFCELIAILIQLLNKMQLLVIVKIFYPVLDF